MTSSFIFYRRPDAKDCGTACLRIVAKHYGKLILPKEMRELSETTRVGSNLLKLSDAEEVIGFKSLGAKLDYHKLKEALLHLMIHWNKNHFVMVCVMTKDVVHISGPSYGIISYAKKEFLSGWIGNNVTENTKEGIALLLEVTLPDSKNCSGRIPTKTLLSSYINAFLSIKGY